MTPIRVVEIVPKRLLEVVSLTVVEIVPVLVVEMVPVLVVEMVPLLANAGADSTVRNTPAQTMDTRFFMVSSCVAIGKGFWSGLRFASEANFNRPLQ